MVLNVNFGKVGLEDQRGGSIDIRYNTGKAVVNKRSDHFGDVSINMGKGSDYIGRGVDQKSEILNALNSVIKSK